MHFYSLSPLNVVVASALAGLVMLVFAQPAQAQQAVNAASAIAAFGEVAKTLQHPRCLNCHQADVPLQKSGRVHVPLVVRGVADNGVPGMSCNSCHALDTGNNAVTGVPGAPHWQLAPRSMNWAGMDVNGLCLMLRDPKRNGGRDGAALLAHMTKDALVLWGWNPGADREPVPMPHQQFLKHVATWVAGDMACKP